MTNGRGACLMFRASCTLVVLLVVYPSWISIVVVVHAVFDCWVNRKGNAFSEPTDLFNASCRWVGYRSKTRPVPGCSKMAGISGSSSWFIPCSMENHRQPDSCQHLTTTHCPAHLVSNILTKALHEHLQLSLAWFLGTRDKKLLFQWAIWLVGLNPSEKYESQLGWWFPNIPNIWKHKIDGNQTTNQAILGICCKQLSLQDSAIGSTETRCWLDRSREAALTSQCFNQTFMWNQWIKTM